MKKERVTTMPAQCGQSVAEEEIIDLTNYLNTGTNFVTAVERDWYVNKLNFSTVLPGSAYELLCNPSATKGLPAMGNSHGSEQ